MKTFQSTKYWIFDLDNTLYSGDTKVFEQVSNRMTKYVSDKLNVNLDKAKKIQLRIKVECTVHHNNETTKESWSKTGHISRKCYLVDNGPGTISPGQPGDLNQTMIILN